MKFRMNDNGTLTLVKRHSIMERMYECENQAHIIDFRQIKSNVRDIKFLEGKALSVAPIMILGLVTANVGGAGLFWDTFMRFIFPWLLDVAKVFCVIKMAQGFYQEHRGGKDSGTGWSAVVSNGKWLLFFHLLPFFVTLIDQIGSTMVSGLQQNPIK